MDQVLLQKINIEWTNSFFDTFFPFWTDFQRHPLVAYVVLPLLLLFLYRKTGWRGLGILALSLLVMATADLFFGQWLKALIQRPRPALADLPFEVVLRGPHFGGFSFPSSHAVDAFCLAIFLGGIFTKARLWLLGLATLTAYSRVYCGVHFPSDVIGGALLGSLYGDLALRLYRRGQKYLKGERP